MIGSFEFNNIESRTYNLICRSVQRPLLPAIRPRRIEIQGKSGIIDYGGGDYATRQIRMHIAYVGESFLELRSRAREIAAWLGTNIWAKLIINDEPDKYYLARVLKGVNLETLRRYGEADIDFECQPFAYMAVDTGDDLTWDEADFPWITDIPWNMVESYSFSTNKDASFTFYNPGTKAIDYGSPQGSKSLVKINGSWSNLSISINDKTLNYNEPGSGELVIDNIEMEVTLDGENKLSAIDGDLDSFLPIYPGENTISVTGTNININVTIDFAPMWL